MASNLAGFREQVLRRNRDNKKYHRYLKLIPRLRGRTKSYRGGKRLKKMVQFVREWEQSNGPFLTTWSETTNWSRDFFNKFSRIEGQVTPHMGVDWGSIDTSIEIPDPVAKAAEDHIKKSIKRQERELVDSLCSLWGSEDSCVEETMLESLKKVQDLLADIPTPPVALIMHKTTFDKLVIEFHGSFYEEGGRKSLRFPHYLFGIELITDEEHSGDKASVVENKEQLQVYREHGLRGLRVFCRLGKEKKGKLFREYQTLNKEE